VVVAEEVAACVCVPRKCGMKMSGRRTKTSKGCDTPSTCSRFSGWPLEKAASSSSAVGVRADRGERSVSCCELCDVAQGSNKLRTRRRDARDKGRANVAKARRSLKSPLWSRQPLLATYTTTHSVDSARDAALAHSLWWQRLRTPFSPQHITAVAFGKPQGSNATQAMGHALSNRAHAVRFFFQQP
jgi:hypothetical protein